MDRATSFFGSLRYFCGLNKASSDATETLKDSCKALIWPLRLVVDYFGLACNRDMLGLSMELITCPAYGGLCASYLREFGLNAALVDRSMISFATFNTRFYYPVDSLFSLKRMTHGFGIKSLLHESFNSCKFPLEGSLLIICSLILDCVP